MILIQHKAAIIYFCAINKNRTLYDALRNYCTDEDNFSESDFSNSDDSGSSTRAK